MNHFYIEDGSLNAYLFNEGRNYKSYQFLGAHPIEGGVRFLVWAPGAKEVYLIGDFNDWRQDDLKLKPIENSGIWNICLPGVKEFDSYKYLIISQEGERLYKSDPYAFHAETRPKTASKYYDIKGYQWTDDQWLENKKENNIDEPMSIYEVNLQSFMQKDDGQPYSYRELAHELVSYVKKMNFTHIELMPITEYPYDGSWGYQATGYFAPSSRFGTPKDFMYLIDTCHRNNIGVILDWVPVHFCADHHGLGKFDGTYCFESSDYSKRGNTHWGTLNFDYSKAQVRSFLISSAMYWHEYYHIDGLRIDAVSYILYNSIEKQFEGNENHQGVEFIKELNSVIFKYFPHTMMIAEESSAWPKVTRPIEEGGLGFSFKWNMGWMNDILKYMEMDPLFRKDHQKTFTFSIYYGFNENYILALSHDEVVHGKKSLVDKMPLSYEDKFAQLRLLYQYMYAHPGKKLLFMGGEFAQFIEWNENQGLDWLLLDYESHRQIQAFMKDLNKLYRQEDALYSIDKSYDGYEWIEHENHKESIIAFERKGESGDKLIVILNFTPVKRDHYPIGVDKKGRYKTILASDHRRYGGGTKRIKSFKTRDYSSHGRKYTIEVQLPSFGAIYLKLENIYKEGE